MFIDWIDRVTEWHIRILDLFDDPPGWFQRHGREQPQWTITSSLSDALEFAYPEMEGKRSFYDKIWGDLHAEGLVNNPQMHSAMSGSGWTGSRTTDIAKRFVALTRRD